MAAPISILLSVLAFMAPLLKAGAQDTIVPVIYPAPGTQYTQHFNSLPVAGSFSFSGKGPFNPADLPVNSLQMTGWQVFMAGGTNPNLHFATSTGSATGSGVYSLGVSGNTERALGTLASGTGVYALGLVLTNQTGITLNSITVSFTMEQWRKGGSGNANTWLFRHKTGTFAHMNPTGMTTDSSLNLFSIHTTTGAATLNGNLPENQKNTSKTLSGIHWKNGEQLLLRWDDTDEAGSDDILAMDQFSFSATQVSAAPTVTIDSATGITATTASLQGTVSDNHAGTRILFEYDTLPSFGSPQSLAPVPDSIAPGSGPTFTAALLTGLKPGQRYYYRIRAINSNGITVSAALSFTCKATIPSVATIAPSAITTQSALLGGYIATDGGAAITEKGIVWSAMPSPDISHKKIAMGAGKDPFTQTVAALPAGSIIYARAYAINSAGTAYGETVQITTPTTITGISALPPHPSNQTKLAFTVKFAQPLTGLSPGNFSLTGTGITGAVIDSISGNGNSYTVFANSGNGDGLLQLHMHNGDGLSPRVDNLPFSLSTPVRIDKSPPAIRHLSIPARSMKAGDSITATISVQPDTAVHVMVNGAINDFAMEGLHKLNDSTYTSTFIIRAGGRDVAAGDAIPVSLVLTDPVGNTNQPYQSPITQPSDAIDANHPFIATVLPPPSRLYKANDTLVCLFRFNEPVIVDTAKGLPAMGITIGTHTRSWAYAGKQKNNELFFQYRIQPGEYDMDGLNPAAAITTRNAVITDMAGNRAATSIGTTGIFSGIHVDAVAPVVTNVGVPPAGTYKAGDTLHFPVYFSEPVTVDTTYGKPSITVTIGNRTAQAVYNSGTGSDSLSFSYSIAVNGLSKKGISLANAIALNKSLITDLAGNHGGMALKNTGQLLQVHVDAIPVLFVNGNEADMILCQDAGNASISNLLQATDMEKEEPILWTLVSPPLHGRIEGLPLSGVSNGATLIPGMISYTPENHFHGNDYFTVSVSDGINQASIRIRVQVNRALGNNHISNEQLLCKGHLPQSLKGTEASGGDGSYTYRWQSAADSGNAVYTNAPGNYLAPQYRPGVLHQTTYYRRIVTSGNCTDTAAPLSIAVVKEGLWLGTQSNNWNTGGNWCGALVPGLKTDVIITHQSAGPVEILNQKQALCNNLLVTPGSMLSVSGLLQVAGNISGAGTVDATKGSVDFCGDLPQAIPASIFTDQTIHHLFINNNSTVQLAGSLSLAASLVLNKGILDTRDLLTLNSGAVIGPSATGSAIRGKVATQYFVTAGGGRFRLMAHPYTDAMGLQALADSIDITGTGGMANGFTTSIIQEPSAFRFEPLPGIPFHFSIAWKAFTHTNGAGANAWNPGQGIRLLIRGRPGQGLDGKAAGDGTRNTYLPEAVTLKLLGHVNTGDKEIIFPGNNQAGYHLTGNPYPSNIDASRITRSQPVGRYYWVWDPRQGVSGGYTSMPFTSPYIMAPFTAFFIKTNPGAQSSLLFTEQCKAGAPLPDSLSGHIDNLYHAALRLESGNIFWDRLLLLQVDSARDRSDRMDAEKLFNPDANMYSLASDGSTLSIDARPWHSGMVIPVMINAKEPGEYRIYIAASVLPPYLDMALYDRLLDKWMDIKKHNSYPFTITTDNAEKDQARFEIRCPQKKPLQDTATRLTMQLKPVPALEWLTVQYAAAAAGNTTVILRGLSGNVYYKKEMGLQQQGQLTIPLHGLSAGIYLVELRSGKQTVVQKMIKL